MNKTLWQVGDTAWLAGGILKGLEWDIESEYRETEAEAQHDAAAWLSWLSENERKYAETYVRKYQVLEVQEDGSIGSAMTI